MAAITAKDVQLGAFTVEGIGIRTTNAEEARPSGKLPGMWERYFQSEASNHVEADEPHLLYALYTEYESDASGAYTVVLGHKLVSDSTVPKQQSSEQTFQRALVPEASYIVFETAKGLVSEVVPQAWGHIWSYFEQSAVKRAFTGDFELYDLRTFNPEQAVVRIYIAVE